MISRTEKNRIIRLRRFANYLRYRAGNSELTMAQRQQSESNANAIAWAVQMLLSAMEEREKASIRMPIIDGVMKRLRKAKYARHHAEYDLAEDRIRDLFLIDIMEHERDDDGKAETIE